MQNKVTVAILLLFMFLGTSLSAEEAEDWMPDAALRVAVREALELPANVPLTKEKMQGFDFLDAHGRDIMDITGLEVATNLEVLHLSKNPITDLRPLSNLASLEKLHLWSVSPSTPTLDIHPLATLINLEVLSLWRTKISADISPLARLKKLQDLDLSGNAIEDIRPLAGLMQLHTLSVEGNLIKDLTPLAGKELRALNASHNPITDIRPLAGLLHLEALFLEYSKVRDISPLAALKKLRTLNLSHNAIEDIRPLAGLTQLHTLWLQGNPIINFTPLVGLNLTDLKYDAVEQPMGQTDPAEAWMPDAALRAAVRGEIGLLPGVPLTKKAMQAVSSVNVASKGISDLTGLAFATHLRKLDLSRNPITALAPLAKLTNLESLELSHVSSNTLNLDLRPLAALINLELLSLRKSRISDISSLAGLRHLRYLDLSNNQISDFSPLAGLTELRTLWIQGNWTNDISPLVGLGLTDFQYDEVCEIAPLPPPIIERIEKRTFPSVFQAWDPLIESTAEHDTLGYIYDEPVYTQRIAKHDLYFSPTFHIGWPEPWYGLATRLTGSLEEAQRIRQQRLALNPNLVSLKEIRIHNHLNLKAFPPNSDFWVRDAAGNVQRNTVDWPEYNFNILKPEVQELLINRIIGLAECGVYDGVFIDGFFNQGAGYNYNETAAPGELIEAHATVLEAVRERVRPDFLILVNANRTKIPRHQLYVNGTFMELNKDYLGGYTYTGLQEIENTLSWAETNLRSPQINCLEGEAIGTQPPDSPTNKRWMRVFTTMSLTHSDGYVLFKTGRIGALHHEHIWYDFWNADLGKPIGEKAQRYENTEGLFIREFTNGWAVYNRSGKTQNIQLPEMVNAWESGVKNKRWHTLPDLDGEIYLKSVLSNPFDINADGTVNILDLVLVANGLGKDAPDLNADGIVNVLDLVAVANAF